MFANNYIVACKTRWKGKRATVMIELKLLGNCLELSVVVILITKIVVLLNCRNFQAYLLLQKYNVYITILDLITARIA